MRTFLSFKIFVKNSSKPDRLKIFGENLTSTHTVMLISLLWSSFRFYYFLISTIFGIWPL